MRQRLADIGGACDILSQPGSGTTVSLKLRLPPNSVRI
jgi:signal transduction histidine kinase